MSKKVIQPVIFLCHGGPNTLMEPESNVYKFWQEIPNYLPEKPKNIVVFSGHYQTQKSQGIAIGNVKKPETIYDFGGFDRKLYSMKYPAPGNLELSAKIKNLLDDNKIKNFLDTSAGYDHGTWMPLKIMYPDADIPVTIVSTLANDPKTNIAVGKAIRSLREEGVLIFASGHIVHNLREMFRDWGNPKATEKSWSTNFNKAIKKAITSPAKEMVQLIEKYEEMDGAKTAVPTDDHFAPLFMAVGSVEEDDEVRGRVLFSEPVIAKFPQNVFIFN